MFLVKTEANTGDTTSQGKVEDLLLDNHLSLTIGFAEQR